MAERNRTTGKGLTAAEVKAKQREAQEAAETGEPDELTEKLSWAEQRIKELERELKQAEENEAGLKVISGELPYAGDEGGYEFEVGPRVPDKYPHLPIVKIYAVDESEAKRWYCRAHQHPAKSGRQVDPLHVLLDVKCLDPRRASVIRHRKRVAAIRAKIDSGLTLSEDDKITLQQFEKEILGYEES